MEFTGERMVPHAADDNTFWEHVERYRFSSTFVRGKDVLDIACGEGYGSAAMLQAGARSLIGIDVAAEAVTNARSRYNIDARVGSAENIPLPDESRDVIVSFETIEHVAQPARFLAECARVLRPDGVLVISTPNVEIYKDVMPDNPFHCSEMSVEEFRSGLSSEFKTVELLAQSTPLPWFMAIRGIGRLARISKRVVNPLRSVPLTEATRETAVTLCRKPTPLRESFLNPDVVQRTDMQKVKRARYVIAVAKGPRKD